MSTVCNQQKVSKLRDPPKLNEARPVAGKTVDGCQVYGMTVKKGKGASTSTVYKMFIIKDGKRLWLTKNGKKVDQRSTKKGKTPAERAKTGSIAEKNKAQFINLCTFSTFIYFYKCMKCECRLYLDCI